MFMCWIVDAGKIRRDVQPGEIFMTLALRIGANQRPQIIRRQMMADHDFLAVDDIVIAVADRLGLAIGDIAAAVRFGEHLPHADLRAHDRLQKFIFLFVGAPADQHRRDDARQGVENVRKVEAVFEDLGFEHHLVIDRELGAAVFFRIERKQPALGAQLFGQAAAKLVLVLVLACRPGRRPAQMFMAFELLGHPGGDLFTKIHYVRWIRGYIEIHALLLFLSF